MFNPFDMLFAVRDEYPIHSFDPLCGHRLRFLIGLADFPLLIALSLE